MRIMTYLKRDYKYRMKLHESEVFEEFFFNRQILM